MLKLNNVLVKSVYVILRIAEIYKTKLKLIQEKLNNIKDILMSAKSNSKFMIEKKTNDLIII